MFILKVIIIIFLVVVMKVTLTRTFIHLLHSSTLKYNFKWETRYGSNMVRVVTPPFHQSVMI